MLAVGIKLGYKATSEAAEYTDLPGLKEVPEKGADPEKVENTCQTDKTKQYEFGIGDPGDMDYKFKYENSGASSSYRILRGLSDSKKVAWFKETWPDGTTFEFAAQVNLKTGGGGVNAAIDFTASMALQSDIKITDPTA